MKLGSRWWYEVVCCHEAVIGSGITLMFPLTQDTTRARHVYVLDILDRRVHGVSKHVGMAVAGVGADARQIVYRGQDEVANYIDSYGSQMPPSLLADRLAQYVHYFTLHGSLRPFGASVIMAG